MVNNGAGVENTVFANFSLHANNTTRANDGTSADLNSEFNGRQGMNNCWHVETFGQQALEHPTSERVVADRRESVIYTTLPPSVKVVKRADYFCAKDNLPHRV
jgi:hypothetical protein